MQILPASGRCNYAKRLASGLARKNARNLQSAAMALRIDRDAVSGKQRLAAWADSGGKADCLIAQRA